MKRRDLLRGAGVAAVATGLAACGAAPEGRKDRAAREAPREWKMVTSWPTNFPGLGTGAAELAAMITRASGGRLRVTVHGAGELVPAFEVFDAVSRGTAELGHSFSYYWKAKAAAAPFFCSVPFGLTAREMNAWLHQGGGLALWRELYAPFGIVPFPAGNTGVQLAGWFRKPLESVADLKGLKMRIPGLGADVMARVGATPVNLPGADIFEALDEGVIDAAEWMGPYNDLAFGLHRATRFCHYPGWQEPGPAIECLVNQKAYEDLPKDLQEVVASCCGAMAERVLAEFDARNQQALDALVREHDVELRQLPDDVLLVLRRAAEKVLDELAASDPMARRALDSMRAFQAQARAWSAVSEESYHAIRG
ncbi:TRAP transporter substrate-binding protein [Arenimonas sp. MALMAid1274]|uniref:TRAP transporter substrate-binding protein n=1 Tax=Arenimonas sp. MALMAid1274 TaxID=3411630 RepID=UPI003BA2DCD1